MTRSLLPPIRTRRYVRLSGPSRRPMPDGFMPGTRRTVATIGALLVSFAMSAAAAGAGSDLKAPVD